ncbi:MAG: bacteriohemerythrin [Spirochaetes bacterium]|nr:bacteriohemerythrin [Spirochaetota bacterium]
MTDNVIVTWHDSYSVGIKVIDEQHMALIKLTNKLFASCMSGHERSQADSIFLQVINEVVDYVGYHFSTEERIMEKINYPEYKAHKKEHVSFVKEVLIKVEEFNFGRNNTALTFVYYLRDWILQHIAVNDKKLGSYILEKKRSGELRQIVLKVKKDENTNKMVIE